jgi:vacuolar-type H+-ATPase subunit F/Vma7
MGFYVIGEEEIVTGFKLVGISGDVAGTQEEAQAAFKKAVALPDISVLIVTENISSMIREEVNEWQLSGEFPLIVEIPGLEGYMEGRKTLMDSIREAIGISI